jgi:hypothetical protein
MMMIIIATRYRDTGVELGSNVKLCGSLVASLYSYTNGKQNNYNPAGSESKVIKRISSSFILSVLLSDRTSS